MEIAIMTDEMLINYQMLIIQKFCENNIQCYSQFELIVWISQFELIVWIKSVSGHEFIFACLEWQRKDYGAHKCEWCLKQMMQKYF